MRSLFGVVLAAVLAVATATPVVADAGVLNSRFVDAMWGNPASPVGYNPDVQFYAGRRTGTPDYEGNVGVQYSVGFSWTRTHCDTATNTLVTVALYGPPAGWAYVDPATWNSSRSGARVEATVDLRRVTTYRPNCDPWAIATRIVEDLGPATLVAEFEVTGAWERRVSCERYADFEPATLSRTTGWMTSFVEASLTVSGPVELEIGPSMQRHASLSQWHSVLGPPDRGQPWECVPG
jgi:hypothetical protein